MRVLVACEFSGVVRRAFRERGHDAWSCDLLPAEDGDAHHFQCDALGILGDGWDLMVAHPPCTHLCVSGARWFKDKRAEQEDALRFVRELLDAPIPHSALENPVGVISSRIRRPDQYVEPWWFGDTFSKRTGLWLKNLPPLMATYPVPGRDDRIHRMSPGPNRGRERSRTPAGLAVAMADQWGAL